MASTTEMQPRQVVSTEVLVQVEQMVTAALAEIHQRENVLEDFIHSTRSAEAAPLSWPLSLEEFDQRKQRLRELAEQSATKVAEVDEALAGGEQELQDWMEHTKSAREKLSAWFEATSDQ